MEGRGRISLSWLLAPRMATTVLHHANERRPAHVAPVSVWPGGRPIAQWSRLEAGRSDDLGVGP